MVEEHDTTLAVDLDTMMTAFAEANPTLMAELEVLGMQINEYQRLLSENGPVFVTSNTTAVH